MGQACPRATMVFEKKILLNIPFLVILGSEKFVARSVGGCDHLAYVPFSIYRLAVMYSTTLVSLGILPHMQSNFRNIKYIIINYSNHRETT